MIKTTQSQGRRIFSIDVDDLSPHVATAKVKQYIKILKRKKKLSK